MLVVAVRNFEDKKLLGFFWAINHDELWWSVDAVAEPSAYEWTKLHGPYNGLYYPDEERDMSDIIVPDDRPEDEIDDPEHDYSLGGLHLNEGTWANLQDGKWKRFDYATEGHGGIASLKREMDRKKAEGSE